MNNGQFDKAFTNRNYYARSGREELIIQIHAEIITDNRLIGDSYAISNQASAGGTGISEQETPETIYSNVVVTKLIKDEVSFSVKKTIDQASAQPETFVFRIGYQKEQSSSSVLNTEYCIVIIPAGQTTAEVEFSNMKPGYYIITEQMTNWKYEPEPLTNIELTETIDWKNGQFHAFEFTNRRGARSWLYDNDTVRNKLIGIQ